MEPIYQRIDYCSKPKTLWGKLKSGEWDWLGIDENGNYRLGYPKRRSGVGESFLVTQYNAKDVVLGQHTVRIYDAPWQESESTPSRNSLYDDEASAVAAFDDFAKEMRTSPTYRLARVQRVEKGRIVQEWFGVAGHAEDWYSEEP